MLADQDIFQHRHVIEQANILESTSNTAPHNAVRTQTHNCFPLQQYIACGNAINPVMRLNTVVFPAPFGPIMLMISPGQICKFTSCTAARPPKCLVTFLRSNRGWPSWTVVRSIPIESLPLTITRHEPLSQNLARLVSHLARPLQAPHLPHDATLVSCERLESDPPGGRS